MKNTVDLPFTPDEVLAGAKVERRFAVVEIMGHVRWIGMVGPSELCPTLLRVDVLGKDGTVVFTKNYGPAAIFCISEIDEDTADRMLRNEGRQSQDIPWRIREEIEHEIRTEVLKDVTARGDYLMDLERLRFDRLKSFVDKEVDRRDEEEKAARFQQELADSEAHQASLNSEVTEVPRVPADVSEMMRWPQPCQHTTARFVPGGTADDIECSDCGERLHKHQGETDPDTAAFTDDCYVCGELAGWHERVYTSAGMRHHGCVPTEADPDDEPY